MNIGHKLSMTTAALALGLCFSSTASAQSKDFTLPASLSYSQTSSRQTWNTVLLVSAAVMVVGLIQEETTLTLLGGVGVIVSLVQLNKTGFMPQYSSRGVDVVQSGPISLGFRPFGPPGLVTSTPTFRPSPYIMANFKF
jgi:hypothetical protein